MKLTNDILHNPFRNRFHYPVTWRLDEMQAHSNVIRMRDQGSVQSRVSLSGTEAENCWDRSESQPVGESKHEGKMFASALALLVALLASVIVLFQY